MLALAIVSAAVLVGRAKPARRRRKPAGGQRHRGGRRPEAVQPDLPVVPRAGGQGSDRGPSLATDHVRARQRRRRPLPLDSRRRAGHADAAVRRVERHRNLAARHATSAACGRTAPARRRQRRCRGRRRRRRRNAVLRPGGAARPATTSTRAAAIVGPDLSNAGRLPPAQLRQKIVDPNSPRQPAGGGRGGGRGRRAGDRAWSRMQDGREIRGVRRNEDTFSLQMVDAFGQLHLLDKTKLASVAVENDLAAPGRLRDSVVGGRDREPCRVPWRAEGARCRARPPRRRRCREASPTSACSTREPNRTTG